MPTPHNFVCNIVIRNRLLIEPVQSQTHVPRIVALHWLRLEATEMAHD